MQTRASPSQGVLCKGGGGEGGGEAIGPLKPAWVTVGGQPGVVWVEKITGATTKWESIIAAARFVIPTLER